MHNQLFNPTATTILWPVFGAVFIALNLINLFHTASPAFSGVDSTGSGHIPDFPAIGTTVHSPGYGGGSCDSGCGSTTFILAVASTLIKEAVVNPLRAASFPTVGVTCLLVKSAYCCGWSLKCG